MSDGAKVPNISTASNGAVRYFEIQVRGWTDFDPLDKKLGERSQMPLNVEGDS